MHMIPYQDFKAGAEFDFLLYVGLIGFELEEIFLMGRPVFGLE